MRIDTQDENTVLPVLCDGKKMVSIIPCYQVIIEFYNITTTPMQAGMLNLLLILVIVALGCVGTLFFDVEPYMVSAKQATVDQIPSLS